MKARDKASYEREADALDAILAQLVRSASALVGEDVPCGRPEGAPRCLDDVYYNEALTAAREKKICSPCLALFHLYRAMNLLRGELKGAKLCAAETAS